ncbi:MAG: PH domain-containing protein [Actinomycetota bacterium]|nr:PH domain-containing protein [Actinomycetota bacterium]
MADPAGESAPRLVLRIPAYQPAVLMLVLCAAAALNIYAHPSAIVRIVTLVLGLFCGGLAVPALRLQLTADQDGISVRRLLGEVWLPWSELAELEIVPDVRGAATVRLNRTDGTFLDVPPSLVQPTKPTSKPRALGQLEHLTRQLRARRPSAR